MTAETPLISRIRLEAPKYGARLFRNQVGFYVLSNGSRISSGLAKGSPDLIGWRTVTITPEMVGQQIAVFAGIEAKTKQGKLTPEQQTFLDSMEQAGCIHGVARSVDDAIRILTER